MDLKDLLSVLVSHDSVFGNETSIAEWMLWYLKKQGFETERLMVDKKRFNVLATRGNGSTSLLCYGHLDTVPIYQGWKTDPLSVTENGDKLFGLGTCDMKGGIAALLVAIEKLPPDVPVKLFLAVDEENDSDGAWTLVKKRPDWLKGVTHMISVEPGASAEKIGGTDVLTLGRRGRARFVVKIKGFSAHGGHIDRGVNAVSIAARIIRSIEDFQPATHKNLGDGSHFVAKVDAAAKGLSIPEYCELEIDRHLVIPETVESCLKEYQVLCQKALDSFEVPKNTKQYIDISVDLKKRKHKYMEPFETDQNDALAQVAAAAMEKNGHKTINYGRSVGDENVFANELGLKPIIIGPEGGNIHSPNEWVSYKSMEQAVDLYGAILLDFSKTNS